MEKLEEINKTGKLLRCPICEKHFSPESDGVVMPFCSPRCKRIDAARWLNEQYSVPVEKKDIEEFEDLF